MQRANRHNLYRKYIIPTIHSVLHGEIAFHIVAVLSAAWDVKLQNVQRWHFIVRPRLRDDNYTMFEWHSRMTYNL